MAGGFRLGPGVLAGRLAGVKAAAAAGGFRAIWGWWFGGFGAVTERPAIDPRYLIRARSRVRRIYAAAPVRRIEARAPVRTLTMTLHSARGAAALAGPDAFFRDYGPIADPATLLLDYGPLAAPVTSRDNWGNL